MEKVNNGENYWLAYRHKNIILSLTDIMVNSHAHLLGASST